MYSVIKNYCENEMTNGLFLMDLPTGFGKTHNVIQYIFEASIKPENKEKKYFFITNLKKNLPEKQLRNLFEKKGMGKEFEEKFLYLNSNAELAIDGYAKHQGVASRIPKELWDWDETKWKNKKIGLVFGETGTGIDGKKIVYTEVHYPVAIDKVKDVDPAKIKFKAKKGYNDTPAASGETDFMNVPDGIQEELPF